MRGRGVTYQVQPSRIIRLLRGTRERGTALSVSWEEAQFESLLRARRVSLIVDGSYTRQGNCTDERLLSFGAWPWCGVSGAASQNQPLFARHTQVRHCARYLSGGGAARKLAARARRAALVVVNRCTR